MMHRCEDLPAVDDQGPHACRRWIDQNTGREVRQVVAEPRRAFMGYFRRVKHLDDGRLLMGDHFFNVQTGQLEELPIPKDHGHAHLHPDGRQLFSMSAQNKAYVCDLTTGESRLLGTVPTLPPMMVESGFSMDGRMFLYTCRNEDLAKYPCPGTRRDGPALHRWFQRPRTGDMWAYDLQTDQLHHALHLPDSCPIHLDPSPIDPDLIKFSHDKFDAYCQRMWMVRTDGCDLKPIRLQERGELITHEFWWPSGQYIAFKYQDRRHDDSIEELPWAEYAPTPTQFGLASLDGAQAYLSDPLNHYHSHINVSRDGHWLCGEGTDSGSFVYAARFDITDTKVDFVPLATIHTHYVPFGGQNVNADFTCDGKWLLYNDTIDGEFSVCAVRVDL